MGFALRAVLAVAALPACWGLVESLADALLIAAGGAGVSAEALALFGGMGMFVLAWFFLSHPVRTYVIGHELTHALWGLLFGARVSDVRVGRKGGSVRVSKSNLLIVLSPYFFPFYTFVVLLVALLTYAFVRPLPCLPVWMFLVGFTWAFHVLFTLETLTQRQPDVKEYGTLFSWVVIFAFNLALVLVWMACTTSLTFDHLAEIVPSRIASSYGWLIRLFSTVTR